MGGWWGWGWGIGGGGVGVGWKVWDDCGEFLGGLGWGVHGEGQLAGLGFEDCVLERGCGVDVRHYGAADIVPGFL